MGTNVTFVVAAEIALGATSGVVLGEFNNWTYDQDYELKKHTDGSLQVKAELEAGRTYQYRYLLNDGRWVNDGSAQSYVPANGFYVDNCVITVPEEEQEIQVMEGTFLPDLSNEDDSASASTDNSEDTVSASSNQIGKNNTTETTFLAGIGTQIKNNTNSPASDLPKDAASTFLPDTSNESEFAVIESVTEPIVKQRKAKTAKTKTPKTAVKASKEDATSDDFTKISGMNKKIISILSAANIMSYKSLAKLSGKKIKSLLDADPKLARMDVSNWPKEAKLAAGSNWDELTAMQKEKKKK